MKKFVILLGGMPASGKTTVGRQLAKTLKIPFFDKDLLCDDFTNYIVSEKTYPFDRDSDFYRKELRNMEYDVTLKQAYEHAKEDISSICISPFTSEFSQEGKLELIEQKLKESNDEFALICIALTTNPEENKKRMQLRARKEDIDKLKDWDNYIKTKLNNLFVNRIDLVVENNDTKKTIQKIVDYLG